jgi:hypothetical protein
LKSLFGLNPKLEVEKTTFRIDKNKIVNWYARLGTCKKTPKEIYRNNLHPPRSLVTRRTTKFVTSELVSLLKNCDIFTKLLQTNYYFKGVESMTRRGQGTSSATIDHSSILNISDSDEEKEPESEPEPTVADLAQLPVLAKYKIPVDDPQTTYSLLNELVKLQGFQNGHDVLLKKSKSILLRNPSNPALAHLYAQVPTGDSEQAHCQFGTAIKDMVDWRSKGDDENVTMSFTHALRTLEKMKPDVFLQVAKEKGYCTQETPKIGANFWLAMCTDAGLKVGQQRIINKYLMHHFGQRVCVSEIDIGEIGASFVEFKTEFLEVDVKEYGVKKILISWRDLHKLAQHYEKELFEGGEDNIDRIEILLGGDHGKGAMSFLAVFVIRYRQKDKEPKILEVQIGQVDSTSDTTELLKALVEKMTPGIMRMMPNQRGEAVMNHVKFEFFMFGDLKFLFMMLGRGGLLGKPMCVLYIGYWRMEEETRERKSFSLQC